MLLACGAGAFYAAMFHLTTHAFIKALLFLSAGNVIHMMQGTTEMEKMGGLWKKFPRTNWLFLIGVLALSGVPPFAAFFSKDLILEQEYLAGFKVLFYIGLAASILTGVYLTRAYCIAFLGKPRLEEKILKAIKEAPTVMTRPVAILAFFAVVGGALGFALGHLPPLENFLNDVVGASPIEKELTTTFIVNYEMLLAIIGAVGGVCLSALIYTKYVDRLGKTFQLLRRSFYVDEIYDFLFVRPLEALSRLIANFFELKVFDGSIRVSVQATEGVAHWLQRVQNGQIRSYVAWMIVGTVILLALFIIK